MKLSTRERDIIGRIRLRGDLSIPQLAQNIGHRAHTVRYLIEKLQAQKLLELHWMVDYFKLGWERYAVMFSLVQGDPEKLERFFATRIQVIHFGVPGGAYDYAFAMIARSTDEVLQVLEEASRVSGAKFSKKAISAQSHVAYFPGKYLYAKPASDTAAIELGGTKARIMLSKNEEGLLRLLMRNPESSKKKLADELEVSLPTIHNCMAELRSKGVVKGARWSFKGAKFNFHQFKMLISAATYDARFREKLYRFCRGYPTCMSYRAGIGAWDYEINFEADRHEALLEAKRAVRDTFAGYIASIEVVSRLGADRYVAFPVDG